MKLLLDTHLLIWSAQDASRLSVAARNWIGDPDNELLFSAVSIWEVAIKSGLGRDAFRIEPRAFRRELLDNDFLELPVTSRHALEVASLPLLHRDPFDRLLIAQAMAEGFTLLTADQQIAAYRGPIQQV